MCQITLEIPEQSLRALRITQEKAGAEIRKLAAVKLFELGRLSSGAAAEFAGVVKPVFLAWLQDLGIPAVNYDVEDFELETRLV